MEMLQELPLTSTHNDTEGQERELQEALPADERRTLSALLLAFFQSVPQTSTKVNTCQLK
ncbi:unnamed protein product, partial [Gulo gulo]